MTVTLAFLSRLIWNCADCPSGIEFVSVCIDPSGSGRSVFVVSTVDHLPLPVSFMALTLKSYERPCSRFDIVWLVEVVVSGGSQFESAFFLCVTRYEVIGDPLSFGAAHSMVMLVVLFDDTIGVSILSGALDRVTVVNVVGHGEAPSEFLALAWMS